LVGGAPIGLEFRINETTTGNQEFPSVGMERTSGAFVVAWHSSYDPGGGVGYAILAQRFDAHGQPLGPQFRVNTNTTVGNTFPSVSNITSIDAPGTFVIVWQAHAPNYDIYGQRFGAAGAPLGTEFRVNTYTTGDETIPRVATNLYGDFLVVWNDNLRDGSFDGVFGQTFMAAGAPIGTEFRLNTYTTYYEDEPVIGMTPGPAGGAFAVIWRRFGAGQPEVDGQLYTAIAVSGDANGDGVTNVGDVFYLVNYLFAGGPPPLGIGDVNRDGTIDISDVFYLINYLFAGGPAPK
jgi:hypothetical protein